MEKALRSHPITIEYHMICRELPLLMLVLFAVQFNTEA